jgi:hypothetical protein
VTSVFGRVGPVAAALGDYAASQVNNDSGAPGTTVKDALDRIVTTTRVLHVDKNRADVYTETGSPVKPFKTIQAAIDAVAAVAVPGQDWTLYINTGQYVENLVLESLGLKSIALVGIGVVGVVPAAGNALQSTANNANLVKLRIDNIEFTKPIVVTGPNGGACFADVWLQDCKFATGATLALNCINNWSMMDCYVEDAISLTNVVWFYADSARMNGTILMVCDDTLPVPSGGANGTVFLNGVYQMGNITLTKGGAATGVFVAIGSRVNGSAGTITNPAGWTFQAYNSFIRGNFTNNGTLQQRTSFIEKVFTNAGVWTLDQPSSQVKYTPAVGANWVDADPATVAEAIDRIAAEVVILKGGPIT